MLRVLKYHGPMTEKLLAFHLDILGFSASSVPRKRRELFKKCLIKRGKVIVDKGHLVQMWDITK
jgi:hypothetical protein